MGEEKARIAALENAVHWVGGPLQTTVMLEVAERFYRFIKGTLPVRLQISIGPVFKQGTTIIYPTRFVPGGNVMQIHDNEQFTIHVDAVDAKGAEVADTFTATVDNETVCTLVAQEASDTWMVVGGLPGSAVITVTDGTLSATLAVDVIPGDVTAIQITPGEVTTQPTA